MANHKSAIKRIRQSETRRLRNRYYSKTMRNAVRNIRKMTDAKEAAEALDLLAQTHDWKTSPLASGEHVYWQWKQAYRRVLGRQLKDIYSQEFTTK